MRRRDFLTTMGAGAVALSAWPRAAGAQSWRARRDRPNLLFCISDDQSWCHTGANGDAAVRTPVFDRVAGEGVLFPRAFCAAPTCTASRGALLTGQSFNRLGPGGNLWSALPRRHTVYPEYLGATGYHVGRQGKGWGPGDHRAGGWRDNPAGPTYQSFAAFLDARPAEAPFCFWFGSSDPHRPYDSELRQGSPTQPEAVEVPPFLPDNDTTRADMLDYFAEIERFDRQVGALLDLLEQRGLAENTIVVITSDNGMPFPRAKANLYEYGVRMPLAVRWPAAVPGGRVVDDLVAHTDLAPTFMEAAGLVVPPAMTGRSLLDTLTSDGDGRVDPSRDRVYFGRERHAWVREGGLAYPMRAVRTDRYLYIRNLLPDRWPAGDPPTCGDIDGGPTKSWLLDNHDEPVTERLFELACGRRPEEELYDLAHDPAALRNLAQRPNHQPIAAALRDDLERWMAAAGDPRATGDGGFYDTCTYYGRTSRS